MARFTRYTGSFTDLWVDDSTALLSTWQSVFGQDTELKPTMSFIDKFCTSGKMEEQKEIKITSQVEEPTSDTDYSSGKCPIAG